MMRNFEDIDFKNKKALIRVDFNVPIGRENKIEDDTRIQAALPTIHKVLKDGGAVILMAHLGKPKGKEDEKFSFKHIMPYLKEHIDAEVKFADDCIGDEAKKAVDNLGYGEVLMLENLRFHKGEKEGDKDFAKALASLGDVYINDAFGAAHRDHASTAVIAQFFEEKALGYLMQKEQENADKILEKAEKPFTLVLGGAKVSDKIPVIEKLLEKVDHILIGGAMAFTFIKAKGGDVGESKVEEDRIEQAKQILEKAKSKGVYVKLPIDALIIKEMTEHAEIRTVKSNDIHRDWKGMDIGIQARKDFMEIIVESKTILWNGPMGVFEKDEFAEGTKSVADSIAKATKENGAFSLVGGGETTSALQKFGYADGVSFVSTGGGALLEYMEGKKLPGIAAIEK